MYAVYIHIYYICLSCFVVGVKGVSFGQLSNNQCVSLVKQMILEGNDSHTRLRLTGTSPFLKPCFMGI